MLNIRLMSGMLLLAMLTACAGRDNPPAPRYYIDEEIGISITPPADYVKEDVWSPDSDIVCFVSPDQRVKVYLELGTVGFPDYTRKPDYKRSEHVIDKAVCELISFTNDHEEKRTKTVVIRSADRRYARAWAHATPDTEEQARQVLLTFRWWK